MKNIGIKIILTIAGLWFLGAYLLNDINQHNEKIYIEAMEQINRPEAGRPVDGWDYKKNTYRYKDQVKPRPRYNDSNTKPGLPDYYVEDVNSAPTTKQSKPDYVWVDGKRYYILYRSNGRIEMTLEE